MLDKSKNENIFCKFENKYIFEGKLVVLTALHIGSGLDDAEHDAPFIRMSRGGSFYIPGSSFRGYLRTKIERLLSVENNFKLSFNNEDYERIGLENKVYKKNKDDKEEKYPANIVEKIFGYTFNKFAQAGKIHIQDMLIDTEKINGNPIISVKRDGIKIDRETGVTETGAKFDYDVITRGHTFNFRLELENVKENELALILIALNEILSDEGDIIGGKSSRGIGRSKIQDLKILYIDVKDKNSFEKYLFTKQMKRIDVNNLKETLFNKIGVK